MQPTGKTPTQAVTDATARQLALREGIKAAVATDNAPTGEAIGQGETTKPAPGAPSPAH